MVHTIARTISRPMNTAFAEQVISLADCSPATPAPADRWEHECPV
jgi:hypothetical protein